MMSHVGATGAFVSLCNSSLNCGALQKPRAMRKSVELVGKVTNGATFANVMLVQIMQMVQLGQLVNQELFLQLVDFQQEKYIKVLVLQNQTEIFRQLDLQHQHMVVH